MVLFGVLGRGVCAGVEAKCERLPWPRLKALFVSEALRKASNSVLELNGRGLGVVEKERMDEVDVVQLFLES